MNSVAAVVPVFLLLLAARGSMTSNEQRIFNPTALAVTDGSITNDGSCPTWFTMNTSGVCECGNSCRGIVRCEEGGKVSILLGYCMTYSEITPLVGACFQGHFLKSEKNSFYASLDPNTTKMKQMMCGHIHRVGQLCGKCQHNYSPPIYSYHLECVWCPIHTSNWIKYIVVAFLPLTAFYVAVIVFRISATSAPMNAFILVAQVLSAPVQMRSAIILSRQKYLIHFVSYTLLFFYGIWNLDFFRTMYSPFCLHAGMSTLQALSFDYIIAVYPLVLVGITYILVQLHDNNFRIVVWLWKPFHWCTARFRRQWDIKTSLIDAFATFLLLSYIKLLSVSFDLLVPTRVHQIDGRPLPRYYLYYDGSVEFFGGDHLPYGLLAVLVLVIFIVLPLILLIIYPCRCFQTFLGQFQLRFNALHTFMDTFQGCYKNGTNGMRDCRYFTAAYLIVRILLFLSYALTLSSLYYLGASILLILCAISVYVVQPYKVHFYNTFDAILLLSLAICYISIVVNMIIIGNIGNVNFTIFSDVVAGIAGTFPSVYIVIYMLHWIISTKRIAHKIFQKIRSLMPASLLGNPTHLEDSLPHRLTHAGEYTASQEHTPLLAAVTDNLSYTGEQPTY